jgi:hypothetical protein
MSTEKRILTLVVGGFEITASRILSGARTLGWRITSLNQMSSVKHHFFVQGTRIHHILFHLHAPGLDHTPFVVAGRVKRMVEAEKSAILQTVAGC